MAPLLSFFDKNYLDRSWMISVLKFYNGIVQVIQSLQYFSRCWQLRKGQGLNERIKKGSPTAASIDKTDYLQFAKQKVDDQDEAEDKEESGDQSRGVGDGNVKKSKTATESRQEILTFLSSILCCKSNLLCHSAGRGLLYTGILGSHSSEQQNCQDEFHLNNHVEGCQLL